MTVPALPATGFGRQSSATLARDFDRNDPGLLYKPLFDRCYGFFVCSQ